MRKGALMVVSDGCSRVWLAGGGDGVQQLPLVTQLLHRPADPVCFFHSALHHSVSSSSIPHYSSCTS